MDSLFAPPTGGWTRVSPRLATVRRALLAALAALLLGVVIFVWRTALLPDGLVLLGLVGVLVVAAWAWWLVGRSVARWGYAETDDELHVTSGALFRRLVVVPLSRLQYVDVQAGPLDQLAGVATVQVHTASPLTSAAIPGIPAAEAAALRDRLTASAADPGAGL